MPIENHWANTKQSILIEKFYDVWTWQQVIDACQSQINPALTDVSHPVVLIQDMVGSHWTPTTNLLQEVQEMMKTPCPKIIQMLIVVSGNPAIDALVTAAYKRYGAAHCNFRSCATVNQAIQVASDFLS